MDLKPIKRAKSSPKRMKPRSYKRAAQEREYRKLRVRFLEDALCERCGFQANEIHHKKGRIGALLTDTDYFMAVCSPCHRYIEDHPKESREKGWSISRLSK